MTKEARYQQIVRDIKALIENETDLISIMATICCELYHGFEHWNWVGFYRMVDDTTLKVGPYHGTHGCLTIDIERGVCGSCVREDSIQLENDVQALPHHIACSSDTRAEIVLPVHNSLGNIVAVLDVDAVVKNCFDDVDIFYLKGIIDILRLHLPKQRLII